jgi:hypothetical protein
MIRGSFKEMKEIGAWVVERKRVWYWLRREKALKETF